MRWRSGLLVSVGVLSWGLAVCAATPDLRWPLDLPPILTSSFGEYRPGHLHAGIDLGTRGRQGVRCFAVGDGYVARMRMSPFGYGKALYLRLDSGLLVVYAHLSRFAEPMAARARQEQSRRARYTFDIQLQADEIRVQRGQPIAWSGQTGVGFPHLHFEVRRGDVAYNPQTAGFAVPDRRPPVIQEIAILPLDPFSHVEGGLETHVVRFDPEGIERPVRVHGRLGFAVRAYDKAARGSYRQAPYRYVLRVDGQILYSALHERFDYAHNHHLILEYDQERLVERGQRAFLLFQRPGNELEDRDAIPGTRGVLQAPALRSWDRSRPGKRFEVEPGPHEVTVEVVDVAGNQARMRLPILVEPEPRVESPEIRFEAGRLHTEWPVEDENDSLQIEIARSEDYGVTWKAMGDASLPWDGKTPLALRARARSSSGLETCRTWTMGEPGVSDTPLPLVLESRWRPRWLELTVVSDALLEGDPRVFVRTTDGKRRPVPVRQKDEKRYVGVQPLYHMGADVESVELEARSADGRRSTVVHPLRARVVRRRAAARVRDLDPRLDLRIESGALLEDVAIRVREFDPSTLVLGPELRAVGPCLWIEPRSAVLDRKVGVGVRPVVEDTTPPKESEPRRCALFWVDHRGNLRFVSAQWSSEGFLVGKVRQLGRFAVLADETPPRIGEVRVRKNGRLHFEVQDQGADLADGGIEVELDGQPVIPEWDPETGDVLVVSEGRLATGLHELRVTATDRVGNRTLKVTRVRIP